MATESAGIVNEAPEQEIKALRAYGYDLGMAFQIVDDIFDFTADEDNLGKPVASDLLQGNLTLPAIMLKERYPEDNPIKAIFENRGKEKSLELAIEMIRNSGIIADCYRVAQEFTSEASKTIRTFPDRPSRKALIEIADYVVERQK
jgi:heptaprenyl diphosphate synthase/octaprenyl-diphosphate synthase